MPSSQNITAFGELKRHGSEVPGRPAAQRLSGAERDDGPENRSGPPTVQLHQSDVL